MGSGVWEVVEKRLLGRRLLCDGFDRVIGESVRREEIVREFRDSFVVLPKKADFAAFEFWIRLVGIKEVAAAVP